MPRLSWSWIFDLANRKDISRNAKALAQALRMHMTDGGENCYPSLLRLEHETGMSRKTLLNAFEELKEKHWLESLRRAKAGAVKRGDSTFEYVPAWPDGWESDGGNWDFDGGKRKNDGGNSASYIRKRRSLRESHITTRREISFKERQSSLCDDCGVQRWTVAMQGQPRRCSPCANKADRP